MHTGLSGAPGWYPCWPRGRDGDRAEQQVGAGQGTGPRMRMGQWASRQETMEVLGEGPWGHF